MQLDVWYPLWKLMAHTMFDHCSRMIVAPVQLVVDKHHNVPDLLQKLAERVIVLLAVADAIGM
jgi:hypothetical protein